MSILPEFESPMTEFIRYSIEKTAECMSPLLSKIRKQEFSADVGSSSLGKGTFSGFKKIECREQVTDDEYLTVNLDAFGIFVYSIADQFCRQWAEMFVETMNDVTNKSGKKFDADNKPISHDLILDMLESIDFQISDGKPVDLALICGSEVYDQISKLPPMSEEQTDRFERIMEKKKQNAIRYHRKLD